MVAKRMKDRNMLRQPPIAITPDPSNGARAGTIAKTIMMNDTIRAISRPA